MEQYKLSKQWVSVGDRLPPSTCVLVCADESGYALCVYIKGRFLVYDGTLNYQREFHPTHWMKLPKLNRD